MHSRRFHKRSLLFLCVGLFSGFLLGGFLLAPETARTEGKGTPGTGDVNADGKIDISDAVYLLSYLFSGGPEPEPCQTAPGEAPRILFVVRHAEKESGGGDVGLTPEGRARAERLAEKFSRARIDAIYASEKRRTYETALPLSELLQVPVTRINQVDDLETLLDSLRSLPPDSRAVVVGHSYTIDDIFRGLGIEEIPPLPTSVYDDFFVVILPVDPGGKTQLVKLTYK